MESDTLSDYYIVGIVRSYTGCQIIPKNSLMKTQFSLLSTLLLIIAIFSVSLTHANTITWGGSTGTGLDWTAPGLWTGGVGPVAGDDVVFNTTGTITFSTMPAGVTYNSLTISQGTVTLAYSAGSTIVLGGTGTNFTIANGASLTLATTVNIFMANGSTANISGTLNVGSGCRFKTSATGVVTTVSTTGSIINNGNVTGGSASNLYFNGASSFTENNAASNDTIPTATWAITSTIYITAAFTSAATMDGFTRQTFGNVVYNCPGQTSQGTVSLFPGVISNSYTTNIAGNFTVTSTGSGTLYFRITGSQLTGITVNLGGNFAMTSGTIDMNNSGLQCPVLLNVGGDFTFSGGTIKCTSTTSGSTSSIILNKTGTQTFAGGGTFTGNNTNPINFIVSNGTTLQMGTGASPANITGTNVAFTLSSGATLGVTSSAGITATGAAGNIQATGTRSFSAGNIVYNGTVAQATGSGLTTAANVTFANTLGVTFSVAATISGNMAVNTGAFVLLPTTAVNSSVLSLTLGGTPQAIGTSSY